MSDNIIVSISEAETARVEDLADESITAAAESDEIVAELQETEPIQTELDDDIIQVLLRERGQPGRGIQSIVKTATVGLIDTYTITYTDGTTSTYNVTNGANGEKGDKGDKGDPGTTSWNGITDKPATFPPSSHNHNDLYYGKSEVYTKAETDTAISNAIVGAIEGSY